MNTAIMGGLILQNLRNTNGGGGDNKFMKIMFFAVIILAIVLLFFTISPFPIITQRDEYFNGSYEIKTEVRHWGNWVYYETYDVKNIDSLKYYRKLERGKAKTFIKLSNK